jgi:hypothetical protein
MPASLLTGSTLPTTRLLLTPREAAAALAVCEKTLWSITQPRGDLRAVRIGRAVRYDMADLRTFIEHRKGAAL